MKLALFADGHVGTQIADWLLKHYADDLCLVVTTQENSITEAAKQHHVPVVAFRSEQQVLDFAGTRSIAPDLGILAWWPRLIRQAFLDFPRHGFINTHPSLLPFNRGKHYNFWAIVEKAPFGVTLHMVEQGVDSGDIVAQRKIAYDWEDNGESLFYRAQTAMVDLFRETYPKIRLLQFARTPQDLSKGSFHHSSELEPASQIMLEQSYQAEDLLNRLRARTFNEHPSCWFEADGNKYEVRINITKANS
ncbi:MULTISPECIES: formyltransferase family protein [Rhodopirellula]|uniref:formyltransferase family protein n=1 Tax=Rhodopirellula TaxID=265488 RepID=UPI00257D5F1E|nr:formyltransferase family protein [Rhodopirellula sp. UBA1907]